MTNTLFQKAYQYKATIEDQGGRLDNCLITKLKSLPRSKIYSIIRKGEVRVNGSRAKPSQRVKDGDLIRIPPHSYELKVTRKAEKNLKDKIVDSILIEDKKFIIIDKPVGVASHGGSGISLGLIETVRQLGPKYKEAQLVHRLDKDTSGCIVIALRKSMLRLFHEEIREGRVDKNYTAVVKGQWPASLKKVEMLLSKDRERSGEREVQVRRDGKKSISEFSLIRSNKDLSLVDCKIITGRTHQIRVHSTHSGHPIAGDIKYGDKDFNKKLKLKGLNRMLLHARHINFTELGVEQYSKVPESFNKFV